MKSTREELLFIEGMHHAISVGENRPYRTSVIDAQKREATRRELQLEREIRDEQKHSDAGSKANALGRCGLKPGRSRGLFGRWFRACFGTEGQYAGGSRPDVARRNFKLGNVPAHRENVK